MLSILFLLLLFLLLLLLLLHLLLFLLLLALLLCSGQRVPDPVGRAQQLTPLHPELVEMVRKGAAAH